MLFHVTDQHSWETRRRRQRAESFEDIYPPSEVSRWVEGNDDVKVLAKGDTDQLTDIMRLLKRKNTIR